MAKTYSVPAWVVKLSLTAPTGKYNPGGGYKPRAVWKPSGGYNPGSMWTNPFAWGPLTHFRMGQYVQGGYQQRPVTRPRDGSYQPGGYTAKPVNRTRDGSYNGAAYELNANPIPDPDPYGNYYFAVILDGEEVGHFQEVSGIKSSATVFEIEEGGYNHGTHKRTGYSKWENIVLKRCITASDTLLKWRDDYLQGKFNLREGWDGSIVVRNNHGEEVFRFDFKNAWPVSWEGPSLNGGGSEIAIETIEIAHDGPGGNGPYIEPEPEPDPVPNPPEPGPIEHDFDQAPVNGQTKPAAEALAEQLAEQPPMEIWVESHCSSEGSHGYNQGLSQARASETASILRSKAPQHTYHEVGYSWDHPMASPGTNSHNRRTEVYYEPLPPGGKRPSWLK